MAATLANGLVTLTTVITGSIGFRQTADRNSKLALWTVFACKQRSARKRTCTSTCITSDCLMRALLGFWRRPSSHFASQDRDDTGAYDAAY
jgi:hypothetical protein